MDIEIVKKGIGVLISDFKANRDFYIKNAEANTETRLIENLFKLLGWTENDWIKQENTYRGKKRGRADYSFYLGDKRVFFVEVKKVGISLNKEANEQAISYALSQRIPFAIATNFEEFNIFCVEQENSINNVFRTFKKPADYLNNLNDLLFLSKESFEKELLLKKAEEEQRLKKRISIDKPLLNDLMSVRRLIVNDIENNHPNKYEINEKDEIVQRIIDRLIFMRRCEDVGINPNNMYLEQIISVTEVQAYKKLKEMFEKYNDTYNSGLFAIGIDNDCDVIKIDGSIIIKLIKYLYRSQDGQYIYDFNWIDADVLGQVYEQYLGKILEQTKSGKSKLKDSQAHKKEQGIYYTPTHIVDFIVKNSIGELLKNKKSEIEDIKILDPSCGSGSFLIKAFDYLYKKARSNEESSQQKLDNQGLYSIKTEIIKNNLYGVDLDSKAVEITKLNLLLKASEKDRKLPEEVDLHIKRGNSLIDDTNISEEYFKWQDNFSEVIKNNDNNELKEGFGFDIIIGNPPWVSIKGKHKGIDISEKELNYFIDKYKCDTYMPNLYELFIYKSLSLIKKDGIFGMIVPDRICTNQQFINLRKIILENYSLKKLLLRVPFPNVIADTAVIILENKISKNNKTEVIDFKSNKSIILPQKAFLNGVDNAFFFISKDVYNIFEKIKENKSTQELSKLVLTTSGCGAKSTEITKDKINQKQIPILKGESIGKYTVHNSLWFDFCDKNISGRTRDIKKLSKRYKVLLRKTGSDLIATFEGSGTYPEQSLYFLYTEEDRNKELLLFLLCLINSKLMNCYYRNFAVTNRDSTPQLKNIDLDRFPIMIPKDMNDFIERADNLIDLNKKLERFKDKNTSETKEIKDKISKITEEINNLVYDLYGLTKEEQEIIDSSLKSKDFGSDKLK